MPDTLHLACAADERYAPFCAAMLHSAMQQCGDRDLIVHFLCRSDLASEVTDGLRDMVTQHGARIRFHEVDDAALRKLPAISYIGSVGWYRLLLPELLPDVDRVLYVDSDTLVIDSLTPLWETDLQDYALAAVENVIERRLRDRPRSLGLPESTPYFNCGVMLMNLDAMRVDGSHQRALDVATNPPVTLRWPVQDALNVALAPKCRFVHPRWNCQNSLFYWPEAREVFGDATVDEAIANPAILHFEGPELAKPWHYLCEHPLREQFWTHVRQTPWPDPPIQGRTLKNMARKHLPPGVLTPLRWMFRTARRVK